MQTNVPERSLGNSLSSHCREVSVINRCIYTRNVIHITKEAPNRLHVLPTVKGRPSEIKLVAGAPR